MSLYSQLNSMYSVTIKACKQEGWAVILKSYAQQNGLSVILKLPYGPLYIEGGGVMLLLSTGQPQTNMD